jgi:Glyoxalase/Bleomycin resistance protein/Dioxygenase superfamily
MSRLFGPIRQLGLVVRDIEGAMRHWAEANGVGPWFYIRRYPLPRFRFRGVEQPGPDVGIALAYSGGLQFELIEQRCDTPSMYREFLDAGQEGMQHWATWCEDYDAALARALAAGHRIAQEGDATGRGRFAYLERDGGGGGHPGSVVELVELTPARREGFARMEAASAGWDGRDPIRPL